MGSAKRGKAGLSRSLARSDWEDRFPSIRVEAISRRVTFMG
jgi:hypothetical protein